MIPHEERIVLLCLCRRTKDRCTCAHTLALHRRLAWLLTQLVRPTEHGRRGAPECQWHSLCERLLLLLDHAVKVVLVLPQVLLLFEVLALGLQALLLEVGERRSRGSRGLAD